MSYFWFLVDVIITLIPWLQVVTTCSSCARLARRSSWRSWCWWTWPPSRSTSGGCRKLCKSGYKILVSSQYSHIPRSFLSKSHLSCARRLPVWPVVSMTIVSIYSLNVAITSEIATEIRNHGTDNTVRLDNGVLQRWYLGLGVGGPLSAARAAVAVRTDASYVWCVTCDVSQTAWQLARTGCRGCVIVGITTPQGQ